jgi:hypothetical protein
MEDEIMGMEDEELDLEVRAPEQKHGLEKTKDLIELIGKFAIGFVAICYVVGLLVVNLYLSRYGVYSLSLFRLNYIMAGAWLLAPILLGTLFILGLFAIAYSFRLLRPFIDKRLNIPYHGEFHKPIDLGNILFFIFMYGVLGLMIGGNIKHFGIGFSGEWLGLMMWAVFVVIPILWIRYKKYKADSPSRFITYFAVLLYCSLSWIFCILIFSRNLYGNIPPYIGGGGTKDVQLLLKLEDKDKQFFQSAGLQFEGDSNQTQTLQLLFTNDNEYVFLVNADQSSESKISTLSIKKDLIQAVLYKIPYFFGGGGQSSGAGADD